VGVGERGFLVDIRDTSEYEGAVFALVSDRVPPMAVRERQPVSTSDPTPEGWNLQPPAECLP
jgi:hypothetical protein